MTTLKVPVQPSVYGLFMCDYLNLGVSTFISLIWFASSVPYFKDVNLVSCVRGIKQVTTINILYGIAAIVTPEEYVLVTLLLSGHMLVLSFLTDPVVRVIVMKRQTAANDTERGGIEMTGFSAHATRERGQSVSSAEGTSTAAHKRCTEQVRVRLNHAYVL